MGLRTIKLPPQCHHRSHLWVTSEWVPHPESAVARLFAMAPQIEAMAARGPLDVEAIARTAVPLTHEALAPLREIMTAELCVEEEEM